VDQVREKRLQIIREYDHVINGLPRDCGVFEYNYEVPGALDVLVKMLKEYDICVD
jgi:hypothetical protein